MSKNDEDTFFHPVARYATEPLTLDGETILTRKRKKTRKKRRRIWPRKALVKIKKKFWSR